MLYHKKLIFGLLFLPFFCFSRDNTVDSKIEYFESVQFSKNFRKNNALPKILHVNIADCVCGGAAQVIFSICLNLLKEGYPVKVIASKNSPFHKELKRLDIPCYGIDLHWLKKHKTTFSERLTRFLNKICSQENFDIIHSHKSREYEAVINVADNFNIAAVAFYHSFELPDIKKFLGLCAVMCSSPVVAAYLEKENVDKKLGIKHIDFISPPHNDEKFLKFVPSFGKKEFFKNIFDINILDCPVICMIANFYEYKNHELLFKAVKKLIYNEKIPVQICLAGSGSDSEITKFKKMASDYGIEKNMFFLGYTSYIPELLFHSDIKVLPSKHEAFGIVLLEAAFMKKPIIVSKKSGAAGVLINHEISGLVIDPTDVNDLASQIKRLIMDKQLAKALGDNAYIVACKYFSNQASLANVKRIYEDVLSR